METEVRQAEARRARSGGRSARRALRSAPDLSMLPALRRNLPLCEVMDPSQVERIDAASMAILEEVGVVFRDPIALDDWRRAGADVRGERVHLDRGLVRELIATIPASIHLPRAQPGAALSSFGGPHSIFVPMTGAPYLRDLDDVRRGPTLADLAHVPQARAHDARRCIRRRTTSSSRWTSWSAHRHLHITYSSMKHSDKTFMGMTTSPRNAEDVMEMCAILFGADFMEEHAGRHRQLQRQLAAGLGRGDARRHAGLLPAQPARPLLALRARRRQHARLDGARRGAAQRRGAERRSPTRRWCARAARRSTAITSRRCRWQSGAPMAGTPEISLMNFMIGQMARHYGVPWRTSNTLGGAKTFDAQAGYESATTMMAVLHAGANYIWHSAGWNEAGHALLGRQVRGGRRAVRHGLPHGRGHPLGRLRRGAGGGAGRRPRRPLPRPPAHPGQLRAGLLHAEAVRQQLDRAVAGRRQPGDHRPRAGRCPRGSSPSTRSRSSTRAWTRRCATTSPGASARSRRWTR